MKRFILALIIGLAIIFPASAEARSYQYDLIKADYTVNRDSTVQVVERQIFRYEGLYNKGWRSISRKLTDAITDISVLDGETGEELTRSSRDLDKTDSNSWGKYYVENNPESTDISWYYNLEDTTHEWIIKYKLHGAVSFLKDKDELYWNVIGDGYDVPISAVNISVRIPEGASKTDLSSATYIIEEDGFSVSGGAINDGTFEFSAANVPPNRFVTIAAGWPKGLVDQKAFWKDFFAIYWQWLAAIIITPVFFIVWKRIRKNKMKGNGVIVPHYDPPRKMKPAEAIYFLNGYISPGAWSATIVDLAVRGYVSIEEKDLTDKEKKTAASLKIASIIVLTIAAAMFVLSTIQAAFVSFKSLGSLGVISLAPIAVMVFIVFVILKSIKKKKTDRGTGKYIVKRTDKNIGGDVREYEESFMDVIFSDGDLDMSKMRKNQTKVSVLAVELMKIGKMLPDAVDAAGRILEKNDLRRKMSFGAATVIAVIGMIVVFSMFQDNPFFAILIGGTAIACAIFLFGSRFTKDGKLLREEWLGFKLYLETAEKYRMQNLTPDLFEKYLPYAMMFGIENKWAQAFEGITVPAPSWYSGGIAAYGANGVVSGFSTSSFSASFSSSFSSAFSMSSGSSGSGGSGGGGSSGGGGGGGGGGAS